MNKKHPLLRLLALSLIALLLSPAALAGRMEDQDGLSISFKNLESWTFVTPDNFEEHMALCVSRGCDESDVRERFLSGRIVWEAYLPALKGGCIRYEKWQDLYTRNVWSTNRITGKQRNALAEDMEDAWSAGRYVYYNAREYVTGGKNKIMIFSFNTNPPLHYESGYGRLSVENGTAMTVCYVQFGARASLPEYLRTDNTLSNVGKCYFYKDPPIYLLTLQTPCVDILPDEERIINAHTGASLAIGGVTEPGAKVSISAQGRDYVGTVKKDGAYSVSLTPESAGLMAYTVQASMSKRQDNALAGVVSVDDSMAALTLARYPLGDLPFGKDIALSGRVSAGARVTVQLDGGESVDVPVHDGAFEYTYTAEPWVEHALTVTALEDGKSDCAVTLPFYVQYEDIEAGIRAFNKAKTSLSCRKLAAEPGAHEGELVKMEFFTTDIQYTPVGLALEANGLQEKKKYPMLLLANGYIEDRIQPGMYVTVYGIVSEPTMTDQPNPRVQIVYVTYQKKTYR